MFYNNKIKEQYIDLLIKQSKTENVIKYIRQQFKKTCFFERELNKDLSEFNKEEILNYYKFLNSSNQYTLLTMHEYLREYTTWIQKNKIINIKENYFKIISNLDVFDCINQYNKKNIITRNELLDGIRLLENTCDRFLILALFEGLKGLNYKDVVDANINQIINGKYFIFENEKDRKMQISQELFELASKSSRTYYYETKDYRVYDLVDLFDGQIVKNIIVHDDNSNDRIKRKIVQIIKMLNWNSIITGSDIYNSGKINFIKQKSKQYNITPYDYIFKHKEKFVQDIIKQYGVTENPMIGNKIYKFWQLYKEHLQ